jgi:hypothetical protein
MLIQLFLAQSLEASFISDALLRALKFSAATVEKSRLARSEVWRVCAGMTCILLTLRDRNDFVRKTCFPLVRRVRFEMKSDALKSMVSQFLSLARLPISPP